MRRSLSMKPHVRVHLEQAEIIDGGDIGTAEIYFEGWIDDGAGGRRAFRIPQNGHIPDVDNGQVIPLKTTILDGVVGDGWTLHIEGWDEDLGRNSLLNPDDLLGVYEKRWTAEERWGEGRHADQEVSTEQGKWRLTYSVTVVR
jgi:hypothetical protein